MGIRDLFRRNKGELTEAERDEMRASARDWLATGFHEREDLVTDLAENYEHLAAPARTRVAAAELIVAEEWQRRLDEEAAWTTPGDHERVASAFAALAGVGVVARMNFTCCQTCGTTEIDDERTPLDTDDGYGFREWAYTFFHSQDADRLAQDGSTLHLSYGAFRPAPDLDGELVARAREGDKEAREQVARLTDETVGRIVARALTDAGLTVRWGGESSERIAVTGLDWRKPLPR